MHLLDEMMAAMVWSVPKWYTCSDDDFPVSFSNAACRCKEVYADANARKGDSHVNIFTMDLQRIS